MSDEVREPGTACDTCGEAAVLAVFRGGVWYRACEKHRAEARGEDRPDSTVFINHDSILGRR